ncbi:GntR family transcriptional regulator [Pectinatus sottacetonis]|uniref:GntR family transcriptional regulator n=1 Tax=Pectinatus sottacetonis TaxID=1002795 RepID=UPI0018C72C38|nr:GntR family transcriptional regulator [Pectinatus sottacetonis]
MNKNLSTLKAQIYNDLFSDIISGKYKINTILTEKFLMEKYNVSRAPIREALTQLTATAILSSIPRQGYKIVEPSPKQMRDIVKFRTALEPAFLEMYYSCIADKSIGELKQICYLYDKSPATDFMTRWQYNCEFHLKLFSNYNNNYSYSLLNDALSIQTMFFVQTKHYASNSLHLAVLDYIEKKEINIAINILKADIGDFLLNTTAPSE